MNMEGGDLLLKMVEEMPRLTRDRTQQLALENAEKNRSFIDTGKSLKDLRGFRIGEGDHAVVIAAGPSAKRTDPAKALKEANYRGAIIATESAVSQCLKSGLRPDLIVSVDPHPVRIARWFGDPRLVPEKVEADDYFRRQDLDPSFANEIENNRIVMDLLDRYGRGLRIALATSAASDVVERVHEIGMEVYWWNPMLDDPDLPDSVTRRLCRDNGLPAVNAGGNVGTACWMMGHAVLGKSRIALTGMDFGYYADTPYERTQYYKDALELVGPDRLSELYIRIFNPHVGLWFYTDPAYYWYRKAFLELAADADCRTFNCTEGGTLFGDSIEFRAIRDYLAEVKTS